MAELKTKWEDLTVMQTTALSLAHFMHQALATNNPTLYSDGKYLFSHESYPIEETMEISSTLSSMRITIKAELEPTSEQTNEQRQDIYSQSRAKASDLIQQERDRQNSKWGFSRHNAKTWLTIALEEMGELSHEILAGTPERAQKELIQCAAVFQAMLEQFIIDGIANSMQEYEIDNGVLIPKSVNEVADD